jgi:ribonuclease HI
MAKQKYYVVWKGHQPGIYTSWPDCQEQVVGFPEADYKSFKTKAEAEFAYKNRETVKKELKAKKKTMYYVVWEGVTPGIYTDWDEARKQLSGFKKPVFQTFASKETAEQAFKDGPEKYKGKDYKNTKKLSKADLEKYGDPIELSLAVDAAHSSRTQMFEYQGVITESGTRVFHAGPFPNGSNNVGEFLAIVHGLAYLKKNRSDLPIYSDSKTAMAWVRDKAAKTMVKDKKTMELVKRGEKWLKENKYPNQILKWHTKVWGEIPADFGRK